MNGTGDESKGIDGALVGDEELAALLAQAGALLAAPDRAAGFGDRTQAAALALLLDHAALRLRSPHDDRAERAELAAALEAGRDEEALRLARQLTERARELIPPRDWADLS